MKNLRTVILAAGKGTRMQSEIPKVLHQVCGIPIIRHVLNVVKSIGSLKTYVVLGYKSQAVKAYLGSSYEFVKQDKLLGTADAVKRVKKSFQNFNGNVLILCGDTPLLNEKIIKVLVKKHSKTKADCTFLTAVVHNPKGYGRVIRDLSAKAAAIREDGDAEGVERDIAEINVGVYCFNSKSLFKYIDLIPRNRKKKEYYLTDIIGLLYEDGKKINTIETPNASEGLGVNNKEDLAFAEGVMRKRILSKLMRDGITIQDPATTFIDADVKIGKDTIIRPFSFIERQVRIGKNCIIGPFARLRDGTQIGDRAEIGNFTEVARTKVANDVFMKHFSYLGDSKVGSKVNIGAGTVTANFNGKDKNTTVISDGAFIGSDSVLIAPVTIGKHAVVAAGSVVTKKTKVPQGSVVRGVPAKIVVKSKDKKI